MAEANPNNVKDLFASISKVERFHETEDPQPTLDKQQITPETANVLIQSSVAPVWRESKTPDATNGVWYCLATHNIRIALPKGFEAIHNDPKSAGSGLSLGLVRVEINHDEAAQPLMAGDQKLLTVSCEHSGPVASSTSQSVSNSISEDVGLNVGFFGDVVTPGASYSRSLSHTVDTVLRDVEVRTDIENHARMVWWEFDFNKLPNSPTAGSTFDYTVQAMWRYQPLNKRDLSMMAFNIVVKWSPYGYWIVSNHRLSPGPCDEIRVERKVALNNSQDPSDVPPAERGIRKRPTS